MKYSEQEVAMKLSPTQRAALAPGPTRIPPGLAWRRRWALRHNIPLRWRAGVADRSAKWESIECDLFHGLPTPAMRAWIEAEERA